MPVITFIENDTEKTEVDIAVGRSLMEGATQAGVDGIIAECGGACACATCHCYIGEEWMGKVGEAGAMEADMLTAAVDPRSSSRLSCQIKVTEDMEGMVVYVPESQF